MAQYLNVNRELPLGARVWLTTVLPGTRLLTATWLTGGIDHGNHAVVLADVSGRQSRYVLRRWVRPDWHEKDPDYTVEREQSALELLERAGARTPRLVATDPAGDACGQPALLMTWLPGDAPPEILAESDVDTFVGELADATGWMHRVDAAGSAIPPYEPYHRLDSREVPADAIDKGLWLAAMEYLAGHPDPAGVSFIHRDYHPYNVLWRGPRVSAVIDWSNASIGDPDQDTGHMRCNLAVSYGYDAAERFRRAVCDRTGRPYNRHWDARVVVDFMAGLSAGGTMAMDLPSLGGTTSHGAPGTRMAVLERLLREALP